jgi:N-acetylneuraminic acid mutarotase
MIDQRELDRLLAAYFVEGTNEVAERVIDAALDQIDHTAQRRAGPASWRLPMMSLSLRVATAAVVGVLAAGGLLYYVRSGQPAFVGQGPTPTVSSGPSAVASSSGSPQAPATWAATGAMGTSRVGHTATLLPSGKVLVAGGLSGSTGPDGLGGTVVASAELYDPATGTWTTTGSMHTGRVYQTATLLPDGKVLVAGGIDRPFGSGTELASAELYDPATGTWTTTGSMHTGRVYQTATLLPDGKVLVAGGFFEPAATPLASAELYDPATGTWTSTGPMGSARYTHTATLLGDGDVLVAGGAGGPNTGTQSGDGFWKSAEVFHPATGSWTATGDMDGYRLGSTATLLSDGRVLVAGGGTFGGRVPFVSAELYDPTSGSWTPTGGTQTLREYSTATLLPDGKVLLAGGGLDSGVPATYAELYDPSTGTWSRAGTVVVARAAPTATLLPNGKVLVTGGQDHASVGNALSSAELYNSGSGN